VQKIIIKPSQSRKLIQSLKLLLILVISYIMFTGCPNDTPDPRDTTILLELDKIFTTSLSFKISVADTSEYWCFSLSRDDTSMGLYTVTSADTVIEDSGLEPNRQYRYRAYWLDDGLKKDSSNEVVAITLDTSSHNFVWMIDTIGTFGSFLNDISIVDENNIWVVGQIRADGVQYNAANWDGIDWKLIDIDLSQPVFSVFTFGSGDIWATSGIPHHWDGESWEEFHLWNMGILDENDGLITEIWGSSSSNIYFVGTKGTIVHYDGSIFTKMESGTNAGLVDIKGIVDSQTGETRIWVAGLLTLLYFDGSDWSIIWDEEHPFFEDNFNNPLSLYIPDEETVIVSVWGGSNSGTYALNQENPEDWTLLFNHGIYPDATGGNGLNDIMIAGDFHKIMHYNGSTVQSYPEFESNGFLKNMAFINNNYFIVGSVHATYQGIIFRCIRQ